MREIIEALKGMKGEMVDIYTKHKFFDEQHIQMKFVPEIENGYGFRVRGQVIYIDKNDIVDYVVRNGEVIINGSVMTIKIISRT